MQQRYEVKLTDVFEGPMDLLLHLIRKNEVDICDIPIALITNQYLEYLDWMQAMNIDFAGDFILMAAVLAHIKSRMLLPVHGNEDDEEDPRLELARPLQEYLRMKSVAEQLAERSLLGEDIFARDAGKDEFLTEPEDETIRVDLFELIDAFQKMLENLPGDHKVNLSEDRFSIKDKISELVDILEDKGTTTFEELFSSDTGKREMIITFLAILEMAKLCLIRISQHVQTGIIRLFYL